jgi:tungstate transport system ATP-binding protein
VNALHAPYGILPLKVEDVSLAVRGRTLIDRLSFTLERGRRFVLLGPNGAGKSLTLRLCHGLVKPTSGRVAWQGAAAGDKRLRHAMVFQRPVLLRRSAFANLVHAAGLAGLRYRERHRRAHEALERFGLLPFAKRAARSLSGGEQQRLAIARAWALRPEVLFLDEPTAALDPAATRAVEAVIEACHADGMTILMTTHDLGQAKRLADHILFLNHGRLLENASAAAFFEAPRTDEAKAFLRGDLLW